MKLPQNHTSFKPMLYHYKSLKGYILLSVIGCTYIYIYMNIKHEPLFKHHYLSIPANDKVVYIIIYTPVQTTSHTWGRIPLGKWVIPQVRLTWTIPYYIWDEIWVMDYKPRILSGMHIHLCIYI